MQWKSWDLHGGLGDAASNDEQMCHLLWGRALARKKNKSRWRFIVYCNILQDLFGKMLVHHYDASIIFQVCNWVGEPLQSCSHTQDFSHHQDYYMFSRESQTKPTYYFCYCYRLGDGSNCRITKSLFLLSQNASNAWPWFPGARSPMTFHVIMTGRSSLIPGFSRHVDVCLVVVAVRSHDEVI